MGDTNNPEMKWFHVTEQDGKARGEDPGICICDSFEGGYSIHLDHLSSETDLVLGAF